MPTFQYEAMDAQGQEIKGVVDEAANEEEAQQTIRAMGYFVTKISVKKARKKAEKARLEEIYAAYAEPDVRPGLEEQGQRPEHPPGECRQTSNPGGERSSVQGENREQVQQEPRLWHQPTLETGRGRRSHELHAHERSLGQKLFGDGETGKDVATRSARGNEDEGIHGRRLQSVC